MAQPAIHVDEQYYILASSSLTDDRRRVLKNGESFAVFDALGDVQPVGVGEHGIYHEGTRFLSGMVLLLNGWRPALLSSAVDEDNALLVADLTNPDIERDGKVEVPRGTLHLLRSKFLWEGVCYESIRLHNYGPKPFDVEISILFEADFADIFEVRGARRAQRGRRFPCRLENGNIVLPYEGLDGVTRRARISVGAPAEVSKERIRFAVRLPPHGEAELPLTVACETGTAQPRVSTYAAALDALSGELKRLRGRDAHIYTANEQFNEWLNRSASDLHMMITHKGEMLYPYAGVPWFSTAFGRDGIITAIEYLWVNPLIARGVLAYLAATQARGSNAEEDAEPGKILHECREGEMAALGEHPFRRYYGSVDATPLFVLLAGLYYERTADAAFIRSIWPNILAALDWIDKFGDLDGDGFVEYARRSKQGLVQQGWKDSHDSIFHADGAIAEAPIALCEVQAYVYAAKSKAAELALAMGEPRLTERLYREAGELRERFEKAFWCEELATYAIALDGKKRPCRVRTSNAGHCLFGGIASPERARQVAETLLAPDSFSGFGVRTLAEEQARYNPMSYHNGSVWPHDNALIAYGLARYGFPDMALRLLTGQFDASLYMDQRRLPELFCGFPRRAGQGPTLYPVACSPQSWAAASPFMLLQACLGMSIVASRRQVCLFHAQLPEFLPEVRILNLTLGEARVDLLLERHALSVGVEVLRREGQIEILAIK